MSKIFKYNLLFIGALLVIGAGCLSSTSDYKTSPVAQELANKHSERVRNAAIDEFPSGTAGVTTYRDNRSGFELSLPDVFELGQSGTFNFIIGNSRRNSGDVGLIHCIPGEEPIFYEEEYGVTYDESLFRLVDGIELFKRTSNKNKTTRIKYWFVTNDKCLAFRFSDSESAEHKVGKYADDIMQSLKFVD